MALTDEEICRRYYFAGTAFILGQVQDYEDQELALLLSGWQRREKEYAARGFRPLPYKSFLRRRDGEDPEGSGQRLAPGEPPTFHAQSLAIAELKEAREEHLQEHGRDPDGLGGYQEGRR